MKYLYIFILSIFLFCHCESERVDQQMFADVEDILLYDPDRALQILDSIYITPSDEYNFNLYLLYVVQCKNNANLDISKDTHILDVYDYFKRRGNDNYSGLASYYSGLVFSNNKNYDQALYYFNIAESYAVKLKDKAFEGLVLYSVGELMLDQTLIEKAKTKLASANNIFQQTQNYKYEIRSYNKLAFSYLLLKDYASSLECYSKAYDIAKSYGDDVECAYALKDKGLVFLDKGDYNMAITLIKEAKSVDSIVVKSGKADLILSNVYLGLHKLDSARFYAEMSLRNIEESDTKMLGTTSLALSKIEESLSNYNSALNYRKGYDKYLAQSIDENKSTAIIDVERKYKYEIVQNEVIKLSLEQVKNQRIILILLLVISLVTIIYYRKMLKKNKLLALANEEILNLSESMKGFNLTRESMSDHYLHNFNILKRAASLEYFVSDSNDRQSRVLIRKFNEIAYGQDTINWDVLYTTMNNLHEHFLDRIKEKFPELDESEFKISCLIYSKMTSNEMAVIMQLSVNTIHMKTTNIRKKLGVEKYGSIVEFLNRSVSI